jgi:hypothetical protein
VGGEFLSSKCSQVCQRMQEYKLWADLRVFIDVPLRIEPLDTRICCSHIDRMRWSHWPDALSFDRTRWSRNRPNALVKPEQRSSESATGRAVELTGHATPGVRLESSKLPPWPDDTETSANAEHWQDASGQTETASGPASGHLYDPRSPPFDSPFHIWARLSMCTTLAQVLAHETTCDNASKTQHGRKGK